MTPPSRTPRNPTQDTTADGALAAVPKAVSVMCWGCGSSPIRPGDGERLCWECWRAGVDPHWIPCVFHGYDHVRKRAWRGQSAFRCESE